MRPYARLSAALCCLLVSAAAASAASLTVAPILIEAPGTGVATVTLRNRENRPLNAQVRVFRWTQDAGEDRLEPTEDVVVSPPVVTIEPGGDYTVRVQRATSGDVAAEEAYRVVVDELPNPNRQRNGTIAVVLRYLIPAFFLSPDASQPHVAWSVQTRDGRAMLVATNNGDKRLQLADLKVKGGGRTVMVGKGLAGYVLGHSTRAWPLPASAAHAGSVSAISDHGPINAPVAR